MVKEEKSTRIAQAEERLARAKAQLEKVKRDERKKLRTEQNRHKYMMGGCIAKYFPECFQFSELELNRIIACAFKNREVLNLIELVIKEREENKQENAESEGAEHANEGSENS